MHVRPTPIRKTPALALTALITALSAGLLFSCAHAPRSDSTAHATAPRSSSRIDDLLASMTFAEKLGQLTQARGASEAPSTGPEAEHKDFSDLMGEVRTGLVGSILSPHGASHTNAIQRIAVEESRLHIPLLFANDIIHGYRTICPVPLGEAATWRPGVVEADARIAAAEARAEGTHWVYAPMVDVCRDPRWGRIVETSGEDPYMGAVMAAAKVRGFQGNDLSRPDAVMACAKHFAAYGFAEGGRDYGTVDMSLETLHEAALRPFLGAVRASPTTSVGSMMTSFNEINGVPSSGNPYLLRDVLRYQWGWKGIVVSDWASVSEMIPHGFAADERDAARLGLTAGVDVEMASRTYQKYGPELTAQGGVDLKMIDDAVRRVLEAKEKLGLFDNPYTDVALEAKVVLSAEHRAQAREAARRSFVLLENGWGARLPYADVEPGPLPIGSNVRRIALIGPLADDAHSALGTWAGFGRDEDVVTIKAALEKEPGTKVTYVAGCGVHEPVADGLARTAQAVSQSDLIIAVVGEDSEMNGEGHSRSDITIPESQLALLRAAREAAEKSARDRRANSGRSEHIPMVVLVMTGRPLAMPWIHENADAVMVIWHPGVECGNAVADTLFGRSNPSGRLPVSFPRDVNQVPVHYDHKPTGRPHKEGERYTNGYLDQSNEPQYPFGFGTGYTTFAYSALRSTGPSLATDGSIDVTMEVTNTGQVAGGTVAQLYFQDPVGTRTRPVRQLVAFEPVDLKAGETRRITWTLRAEQFAFYSAPPGAPDEGWVVEPGMIRLYAGEDSNAPESAAIKLTGPRRTHVSPPSP